MSWLGYEKKYLKNAIFLKKRLDFEKRWIYKPFHRQGRSELTKLEKFLTVKILREILVIRHSKEEVKKRICRQYIS